MKLKTRKEQVIDVGDWDDLVMTTYGRPYSFQQQDGCQSRGREYLKVPDDYEDFENDTVPEKVNHPEMGVSFAAWLARDPEQLLPNKGKWETDMWWDRNFYPTIQMVANDLHAKGLLPEGEYTIDIDW
jgi:hypothetical protein